MMQYEQALQLLQQQKHARLFQYKLQHSNLNSYAISDEHPTSSLRIWSTIATRFLECLKKGSDTEAIQIFEQHPYVLGNGKFRVAVKLTGKHITTYSVSSTPVCYDRPVVFEHMRRHASRPFEYLMPQLYHSCREGALGCLELLLRLGAMEQEWEPLPSDDMKWYKIYHNMISYAAKYCIRNRQPGAFALLLRFGGPLHRKGTATESGCSWIHVAWLWVRIKYDKDTSSPLWKAMEACGDSYSSRMPSRMSAREVLGKLFEHVPLDMLKGAEWADPRRGDQLVRWRHAGEAWRDRGLVFRAAKEGRPMELSKRLRLGRLAGGAWVCGDVDGVWMDALEAARAGGHAGCVSVLEQVRQEME